MLKQNKPVPEIHIKKKLSNKKKTTPIIPIRSIQKMIRLSGVEINSDVLIIVSIIIGISFGVTGHLFSPILTVFLPIAFFMLEYIILSNKRKNRLMSLYSQLETFVKKCNSYKYMHIVDLMGNIYQDFEGSFRNDLESCYIESERITDKDLALLHFKEKYNVKYLDFCIDTFQLVNSNNTGIIIPTDFIEAQTKQKMILVTDTSNLIINTKVDLCIWTICFSLIIIVISALFNLSLASFIHDKITISLFTISVGLFLLGMFTTYKE